LKGSQIYQPPQQVAIIKKPNLKPQHNTSSVTAAPNIEVKE
jgi:hypothetical protein